MKANSASKSKTNAVMALASRLVVTRLLPRFDHAVEASTQPFDQPDIIRPNVDSKRWGWVHYGIFMPGLAEPLKYCNLMTFLGTTGTLMFDNGVLANGDPRDTATLLASTASGDKHHYQPYSIRHDCKVQDDGSLVAFGDNLVITGRYPHYEVRAAWEDVELAITVTCTDTVSWFVRNPAYDHFSLLSRAHGRLTQGEKTTAIDSLCTFEYARCVSPHGWFKRELPEQWKLPGDFFSYQIINLDGSYRGQTHSSNGYIEWVDVRQ